MTQRRPMIDMPKRCEHLPVDRRGFPVPKFVEYVNGEPDFRVMSSAHMLAAVKHRLCWICGEKLGRFMAFAIGPMCSVNRVTSEPPAHKECAIFALKNCPFLSNPDAKRRESNMPAGHEPSAGIMVQHNPGASCLWITKTYDIFPVDAGVLFALGEPESVTWWSRGRAATRAEILAAIERGFPKLLAVCQYDDDPQASERALWRQRKNMERYLPNG